MEGGVVEEMFEPETLEPPRMLAKPETSEPERSKTELSEETKGRRAGGAVLKEVRCKLEIFS